MREWFATVKERLNLLAGVSIHDILCANVDSLRWNRNLLRPICRKFLLQEISIVTKTIRPKRDIH